MGKFQTKARAIELLGRKQIRDSITALAELMKNSYDADAPWLRVEFYTQAPENLIVADSGCGMNKKDIETKWLVLGTDSKTSKKEKRSPDERPLMGAKGIGRLASARLGKQMWMITKSDDADWNVVFINWDIFENPHISLDEIIIPVRYSIPAKELLLTFDTVKKQLISEQLKNMRLGAWFETDDDGYVVQDEKGTDIVKDDVKELYETTVNNINASSLTEKRIKKYLEALDHGTVLFIDMLNDNWGYLLAPRSSGNRNDDAMVQKYYHRFASFISTFRHPTVNNIPFDVQIYIDGNIWEEDFSYQEEDYNIYDIKIAGYVSKGKFYGDVDALNANRDLLHQCNEALKGGIDVTSGISNWEDIDCGRYSFTLCHIEGEDFNSGLGKDDYDRVRRKLDVICGLSVFRDGVRVLPYGEPENDFLNMEERRQKNAGNYIFAHRNIFGRIDINSKDNPLLEDKSSREGLIENNHYFYFHKTMENLLVQLAWNYLSTARKDSLGIRKSFVDKNKDEHDRKKQSAELEKQEKAASIAAIKTTEDTMVNARIFIIDLVEKCDFFVDRTASVCESVSHKGGYNAIRKVMDTIARDYDDLAGGLERNEAKYTIIIPSRYAHYYSDKIKEDVWKQNENFKNVITSLKEKARAAFVEVEQHIKNTLQTWEGLARASVQQDPFEYQALLRNRLSQIIENCREHMGHVMRFVGETASDIESDLTELSEFTASVIDYPKKLKESSRYEHAEQLISEISRHMEQIENILSGDADGLFNRGNSILSNIEKENEDIYKQIESLRLASADRLGEMRKRAGAYVACAGESALNDGHVIGLLRQENIRLIAENDIYGDLANLGLAAEIVNHEFNQLFTNVNNSIRNLTPYVKGSSSEYWLAQIQIGFRAISDRQNQLSPMYRSYSLRKQETNLHDFVDRVCRFMENVFKRDEIIIDNQVDSNVTLFVSPSKLFPVLSNILNNAAYWVLNKNERIIRFRYDSGKLYIEDSGAGITALDKESIFEPFVSYRPNGRGLGLTIVKKVLDSQGYSIAVEDSNNTLPGACFRIDFTSAEVESR